MSFAPSCQHHDLVELQTSRFSEPEDSQFRELLAQQSRALRQSQLRNDEDKNASSFEPAMSQR
jgi:hypothetical protein